MEGCFGSVQPKHIFRRFDLAMDAGSDTLDNSGDGLLRVPGFGGISIAYELPCALRFAHGINEWDQRPTVTAREAAKVSLMERLTDLPDWHIGVFSDVTVARWRAEFAPPISGPGLTTVDISTSMCVLLQPDELISDCAWEWIVRELRDKGSEYRDKKFVKVLDTGSCVCKGDGMLDDTVVATIASDLTPLFEEAATLRRESTPPAEGSKYSDDEGATVVDVIDPLLYPLVYGETLVLSKGGHVQMQNLFGLLPSSNPAPCSEDPRRMDSELQSYIGEGARASWGSVPKPRGTCSEDYFWSYKYQQLPCEINFDNEHDTSIRISSYVNNLHPAKRSSYNSLESIISRVIPMWNECLIRGQDDWRRSDLKVIDECNQRQRGPVPLRIVTCGAEYSNELPKWVMAFENPESNSVRTYFEAREILQLAPENPVTIAQREKAKRTLRRWDVEPPRMPELTPAILREAEKLLELPDNELKVPLHSERGRRLWSRGIWNRLDQRIRKVQTWRHPEPGSVVSYNDWKHNNEDHRAVVEMSKKKHRYISDIPSEAIHTPCRLQLQKDFRSKGLQVIIKISGIKLNPTQPTYPGSQWVLPGHMNEHIVATAIYPFSVLNVDTCRIAFRQPNNMYCPAYRYNDTAGSDNSEEVQLPGYRQVRGGGDSMAAIYGYTMEDLDHDMNRIRDQFPLQDVGSVSIRPGRIIAFPNVMESRFQPFQLTDPLRSGHIRFITIYLVDPHYRICSTRNVPPQQHGWWAEMASHLLMQKGLPREIQTSVCRSHG